MQVKGHAAKTQLSQLIEAALSGEEVIIARGDVAVVKLVPMRKTFVFDVLAATLKGPTPIFLAPMDEDKLSPWEGGSAGRL